VLRTDLERLLANAHLECVELAKQRQWTSDTVESAALAALHAKLFPNGLAHLPVAFLHDLIGELLGKQRPARATATVVFPLVWQDENGKPDGKLAQFSLDLLDGPGQVFLDPRQAFLDLKDSFSTIFRHAAEALDKHVGCSPTGDVRVRIEEFRTGQLWDAPLRGNSAGGALALGLASLWTQTPLQAGVVPSFALVPKNGEPDGNCHRIGGEIAKALEIAETFGADGIFLLSTAQLSEALTSRAEQVRLRLEPAQTLKAALHVASGLLGELLAYLDALVAEANRVRFPFPDDARLDKVRVRVRVSSERMRYDDAQAKEQEQNRLRGMADNDEASLAYKYKHRHSPDGSPTDEREELKDQPRVEILDWDTQIRGKVRHGVIVGDPGLGKTWLMKWEAANYAKEAAKELREAGDLTKVTFPIYCRLFDVAKALSDPVKPTLTEAVIKTLNASNQTLAFLRDRLNTDHTLLLLDAFDEVPAARRKDLLLALDKWVRPELETKVLFTSRVVGYQRPWVIRERSEIEREMELLPFDDGQMGQFVDGFFAGEPAAAKDMREMLRRTPQVRSMAQIPLLLGFLCALYRDKRNQTSKPRDWNLVRRTDLYEECTERLLSGAWRDKDKELPREMIPPKRRFATHLAYRLFVQSKEQFTWQELADTIQGIWGWPAGPLPEDKEKQVRDKIAELSTEDGLLALLYQVSCPFPRNSLSNSDLRLSFCIH
jgi:hypothetical protein